MNSWQTNLCNFQNETGKCLLSTFCGYLGVGIVQSQASEVNDRGKLMPIICSSLFCCIGAGYNRAKTRKFLKIKGNYFVDSLLYITPFYCCACVQEYQECVTRKKERFLRPVPKSIPILDKQPVPEISRLDSFHSIDLDEDISIKKFPDIPEIILGENSLRDQFFEDKLDTSTDRLSKSSSKIEPEVENSLHEIGVLPIDGNNPFVYSFIIGTGPFSYLKGEPYNPDCPPPTYLKLDVIKASKATVSSDIMFGLAQNTKNGGLVCTDAKAIAKQKGIIGEVFKSVIYNVAKGLGAVSISLPVRIFEPRSTSERMVDRFSFASKYLLEAAKLKNPIERMKFVMAFAISGLYLGTRQEKPFNPLLGETFQGHFADGTEIYVEHTAHNPPTDHFDVIGQGFRLFGYYELDGAFS